MIWIIIYGQVWFNESGYNLDSKIAIGCECYKPFIKSLKKTKQNKLLRFQATYS